MRGSKEGSSDDIEIIEIKETKGNKPKPKSKSKSKYLNMDGHADLSSMSSSCEDTDNETLAKKVLKIQFEGHFCKKCNKFKTTSEGHYRSHVDICNLVI